MKADVICDAEAADVNSCEQDRDMTNFSIFLNSLGGWKCGLNLLRYAKIRVFKSSLSYVLIYEFLVHLFDNA